MTRRQLVVIITYEDGSEGTFGPIVRTKATDETIADYARTYPDQHIRSVLLDPFTHVGFAIEQATA